ncbi:unnamed protein product [Penicillium salamii]|uniref:Major facilitator superfamily (MFS) profile domain-containing protein n=1 Tax=Penicillium salamii TaxID=1612424 RepID=A0A9W4JML6_9EURO|nr:unnamed protein product [Penicillium salamii]
MNHTTLGRSGLESETSDRETHPDLHYQMSEDQPLLRSVSDQGTAGHVESSKHGHIIMFCTLFVLFICCALDALVSINIAQISRELGLSPGVELWPVSLHFLAQGCTLLPVGFLTNVLGSRRVFLYGCTLQTLCHLTTGVSQTGVQIITSRVLGGIAYSMCFVSVINIHEKSLPAGKLHDLAPSYTQGSRFLGTVIGLVLGGVLPVTCGWRWGFCGAAVLGWTILLLSVWAIPRPAESKHVSWATFTEDIDWVGGLLGTLVMALVFYALDVITNNAANLSKSWLFIPLALGWVLLVAFLFWQDCWERDSTQGVQDSLWTNSRFLAIGLVIFFIHAASHSTSQFMVLVFQRAQGISIQQSSWQMLPVPAMDALSNIFVKRILPRTQVDRVLIVTILISSLAPLLMAILHVGWAYWKCAIYAVSLNSIAASSVIPIAAKVVSESFVYEIQGFAMGVLCTIAMIGASVGMALAALVSNDVTASGPQTPSGNPALGGSSGAWMAGYRVAFGFLLSLNLVGLVITVTCLRKTGYLGHASNSGH